MAGKETTFELDKLTKDSWRMFRIMGEFALGFDRMNQIGSPAVTVFGSARTQITSRYYDQARKLGRALVEAGYAVVTGGGPGNATSFLSILLSGSNTNGPKVNSRFAARSSMCSPQASIMACGWISSVTNWRACACLIRRRR